jgi:WD40 repeat protein
MSPTRLIVTLITLATTIGSAGAQPLPSGAIARIGSLRFRHDRPLRDVYYSPDGKTLLAHAESSAGASGHLWDAATGKPIARFRNVPIGSAPVLSPDGKLLVGIDDSSAAYLWDFATGKILQSFGGEVNAKTKIEPGRKLWKIHAASFSGDGKTLLLDGIHHEKRILCRFALTYTAPGGTLQVKELRTHEAADALVYAFATSADARMLAEAGALFDLDTGKKLRDLDMRAFEVADTFHFSPDRKTIVGHGFETSIGVWDIATGKLLRIIDGGRHGFRVRQQPISPDGKWIVANDANDFNVLVFDLATGKLRWSFSNGGQHVRSWFSPDCKLLATCSDGASNFCVWNLENGKEVCRFPFRFASNAYCGGGLAFAPDCKRVAFTSGQMIQIIDLATGKVVEPEPGHLESPTALIFAPDGKTLTTGGLDGGMRDWDPSTGAARKRFADYDRWSALGLRRDGTLLLAYDDHWSLSVWDIRGDRRLRIVDDEDSWYRNGVFSADAGLIASSNDTGEIQIRDIASGRKLHHFPAFDKPSQRQEGPMLAFSLDGRTFAALGGGEKPDSVATLKLWELTTGKLRAQFRLDESAGLGDWAQLSGGHALMPLRFLPDNKTIVIVTASSVCLYSAATGKELRRFSRDGLVGFGATFSADGRRLAVPDRSGKILVWDTATATLLASFDCGSTHAVLLSFSPDGKRLASAGMDGIVMIWDLDHFLKRGVRKDSDLEAAWKGLADMDAEKAYQAMVVLGEKPREAVAVLKRNLRPPELPDPKRFEKLLADLDSKQFAVRQKAQLEIEMLDERAEPGLKKALAATKDAEAKRRLEELLARFADRPPSPEMLRCLRTVELLEQIGDAAAAALLRWVVESMPGHRAAEAAVAALERLAKRGP